MKKIILALLISAMLSASSIELEREIYNTILNAIFPHKELIHVWIDDKQRAPIFHNLKNVKIVKNRDNADILIISRTYDIKNTENQKIFADGYLVFKQKKDSIIGGFYWQKGRPNLVFIKQNLKDEGITLPPDLQEFIEEDNF